MPTMIDSVIIIVQYMPFKASRRVDEEEARWKQIVTGALSHIKICKKKSTG